MRTKQVIIIRKDLKMRRGKECSQSAHASLAVFFNLIKDPASGSVKEDSGRFDYSFHHNNPAVHDWFSNRFTKITVYVNSEAELKECYEQAKAAGLLCSLILDAGLTEFKEPTYTTVAIGPDLAEKIDLITSKLPLY